MVFRPFYIINRSACRTCICMLYAIIILSPLLHCNLCPGSNGEARKPSNCCGRLNPVLRDNRVSAFHTDRTGVNSSLL